VSRVATEIKVTKTERAVLERWAADKRDQNRAAKARAIQLAAEGQTSAAIAKALEVNEHTVGEWRARFAALRLAGLGRITGPIGPLEGPESEKT